MAQIPHPIPYQGSKRRLAPVIARHFPRGIRTLYEPFAGSAAITLHAARQDLARRFVIGDSLPAIVELWRGIVEHPEQTAHRYRSLWSQQQSDPEHYQRVRERWNRERAPVDLLYLICRCVKNAVRFNARGEFTQSADRRRFGMHPDRMRAAIEGASGLLRGRMELRCGDWLQTCADAGTRDFVYLDPPYLGTTIGRDKRYHAQPTRASLIEGLSQLRARNVPFALSYDGATGGKCYGPPLPDHLGLAHLLIDAGRSAQATLSGRDERTIESLYLCRNTVTRVDVSHTRNGMSEALGGRRGSVSAVGKARGDICRRADV
ncbi:MAG TPA: DNA adenine methylase [Rhodanobacteraceae bacterium]